MWGHRKFNRAIFQDKRILDLGCGGNKLPNAIGLDHRRFPCVDFVSDLNQPLPFENESFDIVYANQVLEHVRELLLLMEEIHRILRPGGLLVAHVPYFRSAWAYIDPTHCRCFTLSTMDYFVKGTDCQRDYSFSNASFSKKEVYLDTDYCSNPQRGLFSRLALRWPYLFENSFLSFLFPFEQLTFVLTK